MDRTQWTDPQCRVGLEDLPLDTSCWKTGYIKQEDNEKMPEIVCMLMALQYHKELHYGNSWRKHGEHRSIIPNIDRKYDRLSKMIENELRGTLDPLPTDVELTPIQIESIGESKIDAAADLTNYCILYMTYLRETYPGAFKVWVEKNIPKYLRDKIPFL